GHDVHVLDNYLRRKSHRGAGTDSLTPILPDLAARTEAWRQVTGLTIGYSELDLLDWSGLVDVVERVRPDAVVHFGEVASNPYSMIDRDTGFLTQQNNVLGTLNLLFALRDYAPDAHLIKLGSLHSYGQPNIEIEEGFLEISHNGRRDVFQFPRMPGSLYQASKCHDVVNVSLFCRTWGLRATNLDQGLVYGIETDETKLDPRLVTRFDYDQVMGTSLNRWCVQAVVGHPLTLYGAGGQVRGFINIVDTIQCIELAMLNPADRGEYRSFNQLTEQFTIRDVAEVVIAAGRTIGLDPTVEYLDNV